MRETVFDFLNRHLKVSHETADRLLIYHDLLLKWQSKINLISNDTIPEIWTRHFLDSAQLIKHLPEESQTIIDIGSGAGFPGMVLAIMSNKEFHLIESDSKKVSFLKEVARLTHTNVSIHNDRVENIYIDRCDVVMARAVADLNQLLKMSEKFVSHGTTLLFPKGKNYSKEIEEAKKSWSFESELYPSITDASGAIVKLSQLQRQAHD